MPTPPCTCHPAATTRFVTNKGVERFKIVDVVKEKPVLLCEVEVLEEDEDESEDVSGSPSSLTPQAKNPSPRKTLKDNP